MGSNGAGFSHGGKVLPTLIDDIYFLTGFPRRGASIFILGSSRGGESMRDYIRQFSQPGTQPSKDGKINIRDVHDFSL